MTYKDIYPTEVYNYLTGLMGWCGDEKRLKLHNLIRNNNLKVCCEIGIFGGSSFIPICLANNSGINIACDPWSIDAALETMTDVANIEFWKNQNMLDAAEQCFRNALKYFNINATVHKMKSYDAVKLIEDNYLDLLHIDGSHEMEIVKRDVTLWLPKVKAGGYIIMDDAGWSQLNADGSRTDTVKPSVIWLNNTGCEQVDECDNNGCPILRKMK